MSGTLICPHCGTLGCNGDCRVRSRRSFLFMGLGAAATVALAPLMPDAQAPFQPIYAGDSIVINMSDEIHLWQPRTHPLVLLNERSREMMLVESISRNGVVTVRRNYDWSPR